MVPTILNQVFIGAGFSTPFLTTYIKDRETIFLDLHFVFATCVFEETLSYQSSPWYYLPENEFVPLPN